ncbi:RuvB-like protein 2, partial [Tanacetum coccineum]
MAGTVVRHKVGLFVQFSVVSVVYGAGGGFLALFTGDNGEIRAEVREQIDTKKTTWHQYLLLPPTEESQLSEAQNYKSPHGIPIDFLDHLLIISAQPYTEDDIRKILDIRCQEEDVDISDDAK